MITAIRTELLKLRTTRLATGMLAVAAGWTALVAAIEASRAGPGGMVPSLATTAGLRDVLTSTGFALIIAAAYGTTITSSELRHHTNTDTYLDNPNRRQVLIAKVITAGLTGLLFGLAGAIVTTGVGLAFAAGHGHIVIAAGTIIRYGAGAVAGGGLLAAAGAATGTLIPNQVAAIIAVFAWGFGVEQILTLSAEFDDDRQVSADPLAVVPRSAEAEVLDRIAGSDIPSALRELPESSGSRST
jgi:ABC-type transport system involved in multi-copper enzyme maturation permease subunit